MKYVVLQVTDHAARAGEDDMVRELPIIFPEALVHKDMADAVGRVLRRERPDGRMREVVPVAGGFIHSMNVGSKGGCNGKSESLGLASRGEQDDVLIACMDYLHGLK